MNKMAKGAIATGVGVILLVGGGGTLATWNAESNASMGKVVAGDLNMTPVADSGKWTNAADPTKTIKISEYKVVPGDVLTYTQDLDVKLDGTLMAAKLAVTGQGIDGTGTKAFAGAAEVGATTLTKGTQILPDQVLTQTDSGVVKATTTFTFKSTTAGRAAVGAEFDFSTVGYKLEQQAPKNSNTK